MRILSFGHLPTTHGGKQTSGASVVIYQLARHFNGIDGVDSYVCATDIYCKRNDSYGVTYLGWTHRLILKRILRNPLCSLNILFKSFFISRQYQLKYIPFLFKALHLQFSINDVNPNVLHFHNYDSLAYLKVINKKMAKVLFTKHSLSGFNKDVANYLQCRKFEVDETNYDIDYMVFVTKDLRSKWVEMYGTPKAKVFCIPNSFDEDVFFFEENRKKRERSPLILVSVGSIYDLKGQVRVVEAIAKSSVKSMVKYICVGNGKENEIEKLKHVATLNNLNMEYVGGKSPHEIRKILHEADYMILPSSYEGFGLVYLESLACGTPVILPQHLPIVHEDDIIKSNNSILLKDDTVPSIVSILDKINIYYFDRQTIANEIKTMSWNSVVEKYIEILQP